MPKRKRDALSSSSSSELYMPQDVVQKILEKLDVKSLLRFKAVSKTWRREIESSLFQERHLRHQQKSRDSNILVLDDEYEATTASVRTLSVGATSLSMESHNTYRLHPCTYNYPFVTYDGIRVTPSCDGLTCLYSNFLTYVINPATKWYRKVPESRCQERVKTLLASDFAAILSCQVPQLNAYPSLGFGKDNITGIYKLVWLCSSYYLKRDEPGHMTTCEVFSFDGNNDTWSNDVIVSCPYPIIHHISPVHAHGCLHWLIDALVETQILSFDLHTETFTVMTTKLPVAYPPDDKVTMCTLNNRLCLSDDKGDIQTIWSLNQDNMAWDKTYSINLRSTLSCLEDLCSVPPITSLSDNRLLLYDSSDGDYKLVLYNYSSNSFSKIFTVPYSSYAISYYPSLVTLPL